MHKLTRHTAARETLAHMEDWLGLEPRTYTASVQLFALRLPPEKLIEALWISQAKKPDGGSAAFKYFCGVCHSLIRQQSEESKRN